MIFKNLCVFVLWMKVASALEGAIVYIKEACSIPLFKLSDAVVSLVQYTVMQNIMKIILTLSCGCPLESCH